MLAGGEVRWGVGWAAGDSGRVAVQAAADTALVCPRMR